MIGIISDTHDNVLGIKKAVEIFKQYKVEFVIHAGDVVAGVTVLYFDGLKMYFVRGNCDGDNAALRKKIAEIKGQFFETFGEIDCKGKSIAFVHGHDKTLLRELIESQKYDYVIHGHTHVQKNEVDGATRVINPGSLYLGSDMRSIALLDVEKDEVRFIEIK